jgi:DNA-directed RNA polymerase specialized sigma24 family protein
MIMIEGNWIDQANEPATIEARKLASHFKLEMEDIHSEIWIWILKNEEKVRDLLEDDTGSSKLSFYMRTAGRRYCLTEKAHTCGYSVQDLYFYTRDQLKELLPSVFDEYRGLATPLRSTAGRLSPPPTTSGGVAATLADIAQALNKIPERDYNTLVWRYKYDWTDEALGVELDCSPEAANKRVQRAVGRLQKELGGRDPFKEYTGDRKALSAAAGRAIVDNDYSPSAGGAGDWGRAWEK